MNERKSAKLFVLLIKQENGSYFAVCPDLKDCFTQGDNLNHAMEMIKELATVYLEDGISDIADWSKDSFGEARDYYTTTITVPISAVEGETAAV